MKSFCTLKTRRVYQCNHCHHQTSLTSGTIFENTNLPLTRWFLAIHLVTQSKTGSAALELMRPIHVSYNTAWSMKQKIMQVMKERDDSQPLSEAIQSLTARFVRVLTLLVPYSLFFPTCF